MADPLLPDDATAGADAATATAVIETALPDAEPDTEPAATPGEEAAPEAEPPSLEDQVKTLTEKVGQQDQELRRAKGRLRVKGLPEVAELRSEVQRFTREARRTTVMADEALTEPQKANAVAELDAQEEAANKALDFDKYASRMGTRILARAGRLELSAEVKADINARWDRAKTVDEIDDVYDFVDDLVEEHTAAQLKEAKAPAPGTAAKKMAMATVGSRAAAAGESDQELVNRLGRGEALDAAEMLAASKAMDEKGLLPKAEE